MTNIAVLKTRPELFSMTVKTAAGEVSIEVDQTSGAVIVDGAWKVTALIPYWKRRKGLEWARGNTFHDELKVEISMPGTNGDCTIALLPDHNVVTERPRSLAVVKNPEGDDYFVLARDGVGDWNNEYRL